MTSFDDFHNDVKSGKFLDKILISKGLDMPSILHKKMQEMKQELLVAIGSDADHLIVSSSMGADPYSGQISVQVEPGFEELMAKYREQIRMVTNVSI